MKLIEAMKQVKDLQVKAEDLRKKVAQYCTDTTIETPVYGTAESQRETIKGWIQSHGDILKEILRLNIAIQRTNLLTKVKIELDGKTVEKTIAEWIHRRGAPKRPGLANTEQEMWAGLGRKEQGMREGVMTTSTGEKVDVKIRRYYDPADRDKHIEVYRSEPMKIDATLEVVNATTDLLE